jgi:hypothetical protein
MENVGSSDALDADLLSVLPDIFLKTLEKNEGIKGQGMKIGYVKDCVYLCESSGCTYRVVVVLEASYRCDDDFAQPSR